MSHRRDDTWVLKDDRDIDGSAGEEHSKWREYRRDGSPLVKCMALLGDRECNCNSDEGETLAGNVLLRT